MSGVAKSYARHVLLLTKVNEDLVNVQPEKRNRDRDREKQDDSHDKCLVKELEVLGAEGLSAYGLYGVTEAIQDGESGHIREGEAEGGAAQGKLPEPAEKCSCDCDLGEPREVHG
ncbi:unnamed protein product [Cuscuta epithymum]|uniref:Uncharacterized protein n=1 Tax=Cuscuta epithymum TaxID=186058 RepID=A0AAV0EPU2_9ASTE|nr:unnamed protein product [Cuscuta epithymum]